MINDILQIIWIINIKHNFNIHLIFRITFGHSLCTQLSAIYVMCTALGYPLILYALPCIMYTDLGHMRTNSNSLTSERLESPAILVE